MARKSLLVSASLFILVSCSSVGEQLASGGFGLVPEEQNDSTATMVAEAPASETEARAALSPAAAGLTADITSEASESSVTETADKKKQQ
jgi:hypothetical protein